MGILMSRQRCLPRELFGCWDDIIRNLTSLLKTEVPQLSDDVMLEILGRLPMESLCRFKCVSKSWQGLIMNLLSDPHEGCGPLLCISFRFPCKTKLPNFTHLTNYFLNFEKDGNLFNEYRLELNSQQCVDHCCGGLLLYHLAIDPTKYFISNPSTGKSFALAATITVKKCRFCCLAFDPNKSSHFKVVRLIDNYAISGPEDLLEFEIYSSLSDEWFQKRLQTKSKPCHHFYPPVFHRGSLYWMCSNGIAKFNVEKYSFHLFRHTLAFDQPIEPVGVSQGCLYAANSRSGHSGKLEIWMIKDAGDHCRFELKHIIKREMLEKHSLTSEGISPGSIFRVLAFNPESEIIYIASHAEIVSYEPKTGRLKEVCGFEFAGEMSLLSTRAFAITWCPGL